MQLSKVMSGVCSAIPGLSFPSSGVFSGCSDRLASLQVNGRQIEAAPYYLGAARSIHEAVADEAPGLYGMHCVDHARWRH